MDSCEHPLISNMNVLNNDQEYHEVAAPGGIIFTIVLDLLIHRIIWIWDTLVLSFNFVWNN